MPSDWVSRLCRVLTVVVFLAPGASLLTWHLLDTRLPSDDAADFTTTALEIHRSAAAGPEALATQFYRHRGWRPVIYPSLLSLALSVTGGDAKAAMSLVLCLFFCVLHLYSYLLLRLDLGTFVSACAAGLLSTLPWLLLHATNGFADVPMLAAMVATLYHARRVHGFRAVGHALAMGAWLALTLAIRPMEPMPAAVLLVAFLVVGGLRGGTLRLWDLAAVVPPLATVAALLLLRYGTTVVKTNGGAVIMTAVLLAYVVAAFCTHPRLNRGFAAFCSVSLLGVGLWYLPFVRETAKWAWMCSFGDLNRLYQGVGELNAWEALRLTLGQLGGWPLALLACCAALSAVLYLRRRREMPGGWLVVFGLVQAALVVGLATVMPGSDLRRGFIAFYSLFLGLAVWAAAPAVTGYRLRSAVLCLFALFELTHVAFSSVGVNTDSWRAGLADVGEGLMPPRSGIDTNRPTFAAVADRVSSEAPVAAMTLAINAYPHRLFFPGTLNIVALENGSPLRFNYPSLFDTLEQGYDQLRGFSAVVLDLRGDLPGIPAHRQKEPYSRLTADLVARYQRGTLGEVGWRVRATLSVNGVPLAILVRTAAAETASPN
jgi:hypothetical protein